MRTELFYDECWTITRDKDFKENKDTLTKKELKTPRHVDDR